MEAQSAAAGGPYQVLVIPLLVESGLRGRVDRVLVVDCSESVQRARLKVRDGESDAGVDRLLAAQADRATRLSQADDVLENSATRDELEGRVRKLHASYLKFATVLKRGGVKGTGYTGLGFRICPPRRRGAEYRENKDSGSKPAIHG